MIERSKQKTIGSSDVSSILGLNPYQTPFNVWARLTGLRQEEIANEAIDWGNKLEPIIAQAWSDKTEIEIKKNSESFIDDKFSFLSATPDYFLVPKTSVLEIKNTGVRHANQWVDGDIPDHAHVQTLHQMRIGKLDHGHIAVLIGGNRFERRELEFDRELSDIITARLVDFWATVQNNIPPALTSDDNDILAALYPQDNNEAIDLLPETERILIDILLAKEEIKLWEAKQKKAEADIKAYLGDCASASSPKFKVSWKSQTTTRIDTSSLKKEAPEIAAKYKTKTSFRVLRISEKREENKKEE